MARTKKTPATVMKKCPTCNKNFTVSYYNRNRRTFCNKKCSNNNLDIKEKNKKTIKQVFDTRYGMHPMKTNEVKNNFKNSLISKYGVDAPSRIAGWYDKVKVTNLKNHGIENYNNAGKIKQTIANRTSAECVAINEKARKTKLKNHCSQITSQFTKNKIKMLTSLEEYTNHSFDFKYKFQCLECNRNFESTIYKPSTVFCRHCHPEKIDDIGARFFEFLSSVLPKNTVIHQHDRTVLHGKELDIYIPGMKVAFELNGLYLHSEHSNGIKKLQHLNKTKSCACYGIRLIHIFENELNEKEDIVKSVTMNILNLINDRIVVSVGECVVKEVETKEKNEFLNKNHLEGEDKSTVKLGLYRDDELVSLMTFRKTSRFNKDSEWVVMRFCNKLNTSISGAAEVLFNYFKKTVNFKQVVSYSDRRFFSGQIYNKIGFNFVGYTAPNYYYIVNNYKNLKNRMSFQKHKLSKLLPYFDGTLSEWQNMKNNGYDRIWDCGSSKFIFIKH